MSGWTLSVNIGDSTVAAVVVDNGETLDTVEFPAQTLPINDATLSLRDALSGTTPDNQGVVIHACADALRAVAARVPAAPDRLLLTHPAGWGEAQRMVLRQAAAEAALPEPEFLAAPIAAARRVAADRAPGDTVAVLDFGHRAVDMLVVRRTAADFVAVGTVGSVHVDGAEPQEATVRRAAFELLATVTNAGLEPGQLAAVHVIGEGTIPATTPDVVRATLGVETRLAPDPAMAAVLGAAGPWPPVAAAAPSRRSRLAPLVAVAAVVIVLVAGAGAYLATRPSRDTAASAPAASAAAPGAPAVGGAAGVYVLTLADIVALPGSVTPIDPATNAARKPITVGSKPFAIAVTPDGKRAYVANTGVDTVTPIDLATGTTAKPIKVGAAPDAFGMTPDGRTVYVSNAGASSVTPIDTTSNTPGTPIRTDEHPGVIAISPDGKTAYVANGGGVEDIGTVTPIDTATNTAGPSITVGSQPVAIVFTPDGRTAYVLSWTLGSVTPIDTATRTARPAIKLTGAVQPKVMTITPDGKTVYVTGDTSAAVMAIDTATNTARRPISVGSGPDAIAITPDGATAYVANYASNDVTPFNVVTGLARASIPIGMHPTFMAMTANGETLYVAGIGRDGSGIATVIDVRTGKAAAPISLPGTPVAIVVTPTGGPAPHATTAAPAATGAAATGQAGPGTICGPGGSFDGRATELVITTGTLTCQVAQEVLARYTSPSTPKQGSAGLAEFDGWQCGHQSVAQIDATGLVLGCGRADGSAAFVTRIATP